MLTSDVESEKGAFELRDLYENAPCGYHSVTPDGIIMRMNQTELAWLGFTREELIGKESSPTLFPATTTAIITEH